MGKVIIEVESLVSRNKKLAKTIESLRSENHEFLSKRPKPKSWCTLEVIEHMNIAHKAYESKIDLALSHLTDSESKSTQITASRIPSYLIKRFPPKDGKVKMKMKTFKKFKPVFNPNEITESETNSIFDRFQASIEHINSALKKYPSKKVEEIKFPSAIGSIVKFNVAEACEFVICHNERHVQQIINTLKKVKPAE